MINVKSSNGINFEARATFFFGLYAVTENNEVLKCW